MSNPASHPGSDQEWEALLAQLRRQSDAHPRPFFYARVQARLATQLRPRGYWLPTWARRPAYVALLGMLILAVSGDGAATANQYAPYRPPQPAALLPR